MTHGPDQVLLYHPLRLLSSPHPPSPFDKALYRAMCDFAVSKDSEAECWPSQPLLARILGVRRETACRHIQRIESFGWIKISKIREIGAKWEHNP